MELKSRFMYMQKGLAGMGFALLLFCNACTPGEKYPLEPVISNASHTFADGNLTLKFIFTDGDANIGLADSDTLPPFDANLFCNYYEKHNGKFTKLLIPNPTGPDKDTLYLNYRIPEINQDGTRKNVKGEIKVDIDLSLRGSDTVKLDFYITDRNLNRSNVLNTGEIILK